jgi:hypothetical protein
MSSSTGTSPAEKEKEKQAEAQKRENAKKQEELAGEKLTEDNREKEASDKKIEQQDRKRAKKEKQAKAENMEKAFDKETAEKTQQASDEQASGKKQPKQQAVEKENKRGPNKKMKHRSRAHRIGILEARVKTLMRHIDLASLRAKNSQNLVTFWPRKLKELEERRQALVLEKAEAKQKYEEWGSYLVTKKRSQVTADEEAKMRRFDNELFQSQDMLDKVLEQSQQIKQTQLELKEHVFFEADLHETALKVWRRSLAASMVKLESLEAAPDSTSQHNPSQPCPPTAQPSPAKLKQPIPTTQPNPPTNTGQPHAAKSTQSGATACLVTAATQYCPITTQQPPARSKRLSLQKPKEKKSRRKKRKAQRRRTRCQQKISRRTRRKVQSRRKRCQQKISRRKRRKVQSRRKRCQQKISRRKRRKVQSRRKRCWQKIRRRKKKRRLPSRRQPCRECRRSRCHGRRRCHVAKQAADEKTEKA